MGAYRLEYGYVGFKRRTINIVIDSADLSKELDDVTLFYDVDGLMGCRMVFKKTLYGADLFGQGQVLKAEEIKRMAF